MVDCVLKTNVPVLSFTKYCALWYRVLTLSLEHIKKVLVIWLYGCALFVMFLYQVSKYNNKTVDTSRAETIYSPRAHECIPTFQWSTCCLIFNDGYLGWTIDFLIQCWMGSLGDYHNRAKCQMRISTRHMITDLSHLSNDNISSERLLWDW